MSYIVRFKRAFLTGPMAGLEHQDFVTFSTLAGARAFHRELLRRLNKPQKLLLTNDTYANTQAWVEESV